MKRAWIGIALLAGSWLMGLSYYHQAKWLDPKLAWFGEQGKWPALVMWVAIVAAGVLLMMGAVRRAPGRAVMAVSVVLVIPGFLLAPWPHCVAPLLIVLGLALQVLPVPGRWPGRLGSAAMVAGVVLLAQAVVLFAYESLTAWSHELPYPLPHLLGAVAWLFGMDVAVSGSNLALFSMRQIHPLGATWELLVDPVSLGFLVGGLVLIGLRDWASPDRVRSAWQRLRPAVFLLVSMIVWLPIRAGLLMAVYMHRALRTEYDDPLRLMNQFWSQWIHLLLLAVPVLLAWRFARVDQGDQNTAASAGAARWRWKPCVAAALSLVAAAAITVGLMWDPVGRRKTGQILVDEYHSQRPWPGKTFDTTRTDRPFDTAWFGHASAYNYACIYDYCSRFYEMSRLTKRIDDAALSDCEVLVLKVPTGSYTDREVDAVRRFVERGGGLLLVGEHTSVYGSGVYLNQIARTFGFTFRYDCVFGIDAFFTQRYEPPVAPHPVIQHMPPLDFATSCSIEPHGPGRAVIRSTGLKNLGANYHAINFYPQTQNRPQMRYGAFVQLWATRHGAGRVLAFTDSTIFANFSTFEPGKSELMLGMLEWLNHRDAIGNPRPWLAALGLLLIAAALVLGWLWGGNWLLMLAAGTLGWAASSFGLLVASRAAMPLPTAVRPMVRVAMDRAVCDAPLPKNGFIGGKKDEFGQFERSILRLGYFTCRSADPDLADADLVVLLHPNQTVPGEFRERLVDYVAKGGKLLILDSPENTKSTANSLLSPFGLSVKRPLPSRGQLASPKGWPSMPIASAVEVDGGTPLARLHGRPVAACSRHGGGSVTVIGFGSRFTDANMGVIGDVIPDANLRKVFDFEFILLRAIVTDKLPHAQR